MYCVFCGGLLDINDRCPKCTAEMMTDKVLLELGDKEIRRFRFKIKKEELQKLRKEGGGQQDGRAIA